MLNNKLFQEELLKLSKKTDLKEFRKEFIYKGYICIINKNIFTDGNFDGYVAIPEGNKFYRFETDEYKNIRDTLSIKLTAEGEQNSYRVYLPGLINGTKCNWVGYEKGNLQRFGLLFVHAIEAECEMSKKIAKNIIDMLSIQSQEPVKDIEFMENKLKKLVNKIIKLNKEKS
jgi:hypothetical protein